MTATRLDKNFEETDERVESEVFSFSTYITPISNLKGKASSYTYWPDDYEGSAFVDITWEDSPNIEYVQITFEPALEGVEQPIKVAAGKQQCHIEGFNGWGSVAGSPEPQVYEFTVKTYGIDGFMTEGQSFKAQPLTKSFVHDADYNTYVPIKMGDQVWLSSNLRTTHFNNGVEIGDDILINRGWSDGEHSFDEYIYKLGEYDTNTLKENKGMCPEGFHISNHDDWAKLERYIGIENESSLFQTFGEDKKVANILKSEEGWGVKKDGTNANGKSLFFNLKPSIHGATYKLSNSKTYVEEYARYTDKLDGLCTAILMTSETIFGLISSTRVLSADSDGIFVPWQIRGVIRCVQDAE